MADRDNDLVKALCAAERNIRGEIREWIQSEVNALLVEAQIDDGRLGGMVADSITGAIERLRAINNTEIRDAVVAIDHVINEVSNGGYTDVHDAYTQLQNGCMGLEHIIRELQNLRSFVGEMRNA